MLEQTAGFCPVQYDRIFNPSKVDRNNKRLSFFYKTYMAYQRFVQDTIDGFPVVMPALREAIDAVLVCLLEMCHGFALCKVRFYITAPSLVYLGCMHYSLVSGKSTDQELLSPASRPNPARAGFSHGSASNAFATSAAAGE